MTDPRRSTGAAGEALAEIYVQRKGYSVLARNWRCAAGELDLIAQDGSTLVFVEVRTRRGTAQGSAEESITPSKQRRLVMLAETYLAQQTAHGHAWAGEWRIDVIAIHIDPRGLSQINHLINAIET